MTDFDWDEEGEYDEDDWDYDDDTQWGDEMFDDDGDYDNEPDDDDRVDESDWHNILVEDVGWLDVRDPQLYSYVSRWYVARHILAHFWAWKIHGPFFRFRHNLMRPFKHCVNCGKRGVGPYWFCDTCSEECSRAQYAKRVADHKKLHLRKDDHYTVCGEWIWQEIKIGELPIASKDAFCSRCLSKQGVI